MWLKHINTNIDVCNSRILFTLITFYLVIVSKRYLVVSDCCLAPSKQFQDENKFISMRWWWLPSWIFTVLAHRNNRPWVDMSLSSDILSWFQNLPVFAVTLTELLSCPDIVFIDGSRECRMSYAHYWWPDCDCEM